MTRHFAVLHCLTSVAGFTATIMTATSTRCLQSPSTSSQRRELIQFGVMMPLVYTLLPKIFAPHADLSREAVSKPLEAMWRDIDLSSPSRAASSLRAAFHGTGIGDEEIVALAAARSALSHWAPAVDISTPALLALDNSYFVLLRSLHWTPRDWSGPALYQDGSGALTVDPLDRALIEDSSFKAHVDAYGANDRKFRRNYAAALQKLQKR